MDAQMNGYTYMFVCMNEWMDGVIWSHSWMDGWTEMDEWIDACMGE